ncbi:outer membrane protein transport protein [bacterium]|nr:outer membrane protein transport protein [bacterium]
MRHHSAPVRRPDAGVARIKSCERRSNSRKFRVLAVPILVIAVLFSGVAPNAHAAGFFTGEIGARTSGKGGANIAGEDTPNALYLNPAALYRVRGSNLMAQADFDIYRTYYRREPYLPGQYNRNPLDTIPGLFVTTDFGEDKDVTFAYGMYGPYGVTARYPETHAGRYNVIETNSSQVYFSSGLGFKIAPWLALGGGISLINVSIRNFYGFTVVGERDPRYDTVAEFYAHNKTRPAWFAGFILFPDDKVQIAASMIPRLARMKFTGYLRAELPPLYGAILGEDVYKDELKTHVDYPEQYRFGLRFVPMDLFDIEFGATFIPWSLVVGYDIDLEDEVLIKDFFLPLEWRDAWTYRVGTDWKVHKNFRVRAGYFYEEGATPEESLGAGAIDTNRHGYAVGFSATFFGVTTDWAYNHIALDDYVVPANPEADVLDDGRGYIDGAYDRIIGAVILNAEGMVQAFKGKKK